jgi:hypothetical protein
MTWYAILTSPLAAYLVSGVVVTAIPQCGVRQSCPVASGGVSRTTLIQS